jgi:hypothetical protein
MSALGQKRTFAPQTGMSALPPKADICSATAHVCYGPIADIGRSEIAVMYFIPAARLGSVKSLRARVHTAPIELRSEMVPPVMG